MVLRIAACPTRTTPYRVAVSLPRSRAKIAERDAIGRSDVALGSPDHIYRRSDIDIRKWWDLQLEIKGLETALGVAGAEMRRSGS